MTLLRILLAALVLASVQFAAPASHAQIFEPRYYPPGSYRPQPPPQQRRLPGTGEDYAPRRQYVPEQRTSRRQERNFFQRLFGMPSQPASPRSGTEMWGGGAPDADAEQAAPKKVVPKTIFVAVLGDSLAENLVPGLTEALAERPEVGLVREIRPGVGFLKENPKSWKVVADEVLARDPSVAAAVVFLGPQDDPPAPPKKKKKDVELQTEAPALAASPWMDSYAAKVDEVALAFRQKGIPLLWVGLPPVADEKTTVDHLFLNDLVRQRVAALGGTFIDVWEGFVDEDEKFTEQGPNIEGRVVRLRTTDGVHFTKAGALKIGHSVELELRTILAPKESGDAIADLTGFDSTAPTTPGSSRILLLGQAPRTPGAILIPPAPPTPAPKAPEFNPGVVTGPEGAAPDPSATQTPKVEENSIVTGAAVPAKPGRADDFTWNASAAN